MTKIGFSNDHEQKLKSEATRQRHLVEYAKHHKKTMTGWGLIYTVLIFGPGLAVCAFLALLSLPLLLLGAVVLLRAPSACCSTSKRTEDIGQWLAGTAPKPKFACFPNPCCFAPFCCWFGRTRDPVPDKLRGVFLMENNVASEDFCLMDAGEWDAASRKLTIRLFAPLGWTNPRTWSGAVSHLVTRLIRMEGDFCFDENLENCHIVFRSFLLTWPAPLMGMTIHEEPGSNGALWFRCNHSADSRSMEYAVVRVVGYDGKGGYHKEEPARPWVSEGGGVWRRRRSPPLAAFSTMMAKTKEATPGFVLMAEEQFSLGLCCACGVSKVEPEVEV